MSVTHILWSAAGAPQGMGDECGTCRICGESGVGLLFDVWVRDSFTDWDKILPGSIICQACQFAFSEVNPLLASLVGKDKPQRMRNYSHFVIDGQWIPLTKGDRDRMLEILKAAFTLAVVAESGQKHLIFRATPGVVQFEEYRVYELDVALDYLLPHMKMLCAGFSKSEIATGQYKQDRIVRFGISEWHALERKLKEWRATPPFNLALFLA